MRFNNIIKKYWYLLLIPAIIIVFSFGFAILRNIDEKNVEPIKITEKNDEEKEKELVRSFSNGIYVDKGRENIYPIAVVIDNLDPARPQAGLSEASIVYEAEAEGGVTRYLSIFTNYDNIKKIGPVRSARPYFVDWAGEYSALFAHCGGSPDSLAKIKADKIFDLNEFYNGGSFWRESSNAPHNIFTSGKLLKTYLEKENKREGRYEAWKFKDDAEEKDRPDKNDIKITFNSGYAIEWKYSKPENSYIRFLNDSVYKDASGNKITVKDIVIQYIPAKVIDNKLRLSMKTTGSGKLLACIDGKCEKGIWKKPSENSRTIFYNEIGNEIKLNSGQIWIEIVQPGMKVDY